MVKDGFEGVLAEDGSGDVVGFTWCYSLPAESVGRIDFALMNCVLKKNGLEPSQAIYGAEMGVLPAYRGLGVAYSLLKARLDSSEADLSITRTKNPKMLYLYRKTLGDPILSFREESSYKGGVAYVFAKTI